MFWGRLVPVVRTPISIPAGFAEMNVQKFSLYSAFGWAIYMSLLAGLGYSDGETAAPMELAFAAVWPFVQSNPVLATVGTAFASAVGIVAWKRRTELSY
jgi:membrane protein DedA with SNARE-associated domain